MPVVKLTPEEIAREQFVTVSPELSMRVKSPETEQFEPLTATVTKLTPEEVADVETIERVSVPPESLDTPLLTKVDGGFRRTVQGEGGPTTPEELKSFIQGRRQVEKSTRDVERLRKRDEDLALGIPKEPRDSLPVRAFKKFSNQLILEDIEQARPSTSFARALGTLDQAAPAIQAFAEAPWYKKPIEFPKAVFALTKAYYSPKGREIEATLRQERGDVTLDVPPAETFLEKATDVGAGVGAFVTRLAVARKITTSILPTAKLPTAMTEALAWELSNTDAPLGQGALMAGAFGFLGKYKPGSLKQDIGITAARSAFFASLTKATGGDLEDVLISAFIPIALRGGREIKNRVLWRDIGAYKARVEKAIKARKSADPAREIRERHDALRSFVGNRTEAELTNLRARLSAKPNPANQAIVQEIDIKLSQLGSPVFATPAAPVSPVSRTQLALPPGAPTAPQVSAPTPAAPVIAQPVPERQVIPREDTQLAQEAPRVLAPAPPSEETLGERIARLRTKITPVHLTQEQQDNWTDSMIAKYGDRWLKDSITWETAKELGDTKRAKEVEARVNVADLERERAIVKGKLIDERADFEPEQRRIEKAVTDSVKGDKEIAQAVLKVYGLDFKADDVGMILARENLQELLKEPNSRRETRIGVAQIIAERQGSDFEGLMSSSSALTNVGKKAFIDRINALVLSAEQALLKSLGIEEKITDFSLSLGNQPPLLKTERSIPAPPTLAAPAAEEEITGVEIAVERPTAKKVLRQKITPTPKAPDAEAQRVAEEAEREAIRQFDPPASDPAKQHEKLLTTHAKPDVSAPTKAPKAEPTEIIAAKKQATELTAQLESFGFSENKKTAESKGLVYVGKGASPEARSQALKDPRVARVIARKGSVRGVFAEAKKTEETRIKREAEKRDRQETRAILRELKLAPGDLPDARSRDIPYNVFRTPFSEAYKVNPLARKMFEKAFDASERAGQEEFKFIQEFSKLLSESRKSRKPGKLVPTDPELFEALEGRLSPSKLTIADQKLFKFLDKFRNDVRDIMTEEGRARENYVTHIPASVWEIWKEEGLTDALRYKFGKAKKEDVNPLLNADLMVADKKFNPFALERTGKIRPSKDLARVVEPYAKIFFLKKNIDPIRPLAKKTLALFKKNNLGHAEKFVARYMKRISSENMDLLTIGKKGEATIDVLMSMTAWRFLSFNVDAGILNTIAGGLDNFIEMEIPEFVRGVARFETKRGQEILDQQKVVDIETWAQMRGIRHSLSSSIKKVAFASMSGFGRLPWGERAIQGMHYLGRLSKQEMRTKNIPPEKHRELMIDIAQIHGAYRSNLTQEAARVPILRPIFQFKRWMISKIHRRLNRYGPALINDIRAGKVNTKNMRSIAKEVGIIALLLFASHYDDLDDDTKKWMDDLITDIYGSFSINRWAFTLSAGLPIGKNLADILTALFQAATRVRFKVNAKYGKKGELKVVPTILDLLPGRKILKKQLLEEEKKSASSSRAIGFKLAEEFK